MSKKKWSKDDLTIAYYFSKWNLTGLGIEQDELVESVLNTTHYSFNSQVANFRSILNIEGHQLEHASKAMKDLIVEYKGLTMMQVRIIVIDFIMAEQTEERPTVAETDAKAHNEKIAKQTEKLNQKSRVTWAQHIKGLQKHRNLKKID